jgi:hypothetical protein
MGPRLCPSSTSEWVRISLDVRADGCLTSEANTVLLERDTKDSNRLHKHWRKGRFCKELNRTLTGGQEQDKALSADEDSDDAEAPEPNVSFVGNNPTALIDPRERRPLVPDSITMNRPSPLAHPTPLPSDCFRLLEAYHSYVQSWLPICEKLDILKLSYSYPSHGLLLSPDMPESGSHAEMWSMLAVGSCLLDGGNSRGSPDPTTLYTTAQTLIPQERGQFSLSHVKALLNLALFNIRDSHDDAAWLLVGAASRLLPSVKAGPGENATRLAHVMASCYVLDHFLALSLHRRPYLNATDVETAGKIEEDGLEEW